MNWSTTPEHAAARPTPATASPSLDQAQLVFTPMGASDIEAVMAIEAVAYPFPWVSQNFHDSLHSGYQAWTMRDDQRRLLGYFLMMVAVDEAHLLNITVDIPWQGQGAGLRLLDNATNLARELGMHSVLLEVRPSNTRAMAIYQRYGFQQIGLRKNYYPAALGQRENALVMRLPL